MERETIFLDHGATSWPKPKEVLESIAEFFEGVAANAGRSGHQASLRSARVIFDCRERLAALLGVKDSQNLVFTRGTTEGANLVLKGFLAMGDLVFHTPLEHNAVARPLHRLSQDRDVRTVPLPADAFGRVDWEEAKALAASGAPRLVAVTHASNVNGVVQDLRLARSAFPHAALFVDAAQTAGVLPIDIEGMGIDFLACSAHKGLLGPTGIGVCYLHPDRNVAPLVEGGTGSRSEDTVQPVLRPDRYESGTQNLHGLAGLQGALSHMETEGFTGEHKLGLSARLSGGLQKIPGCTLHTPSDGTALLVSFTLAGLTPDRIAARLEKDFGILVRPGLQCAPMAHRHLGTFPHGTVRLSPGWGNTEAHIDKAVEAVGVIAAGA